MSEILVEIFTAAGKIVGTFKNPTVEMLPEHHYLIRGRFFEADGSAAEKLEFNPQALPYKADISQVSHCAHKKLVGVYVHRGRQPVQMIGVCETAETAARYTF